jgi:hypothetical protein
MRKGIPIIVGLAVFIGTTGIARAQSGFGGLGDAVKKSAADAAKQEIDKAAGVSGAADKAADPKAAAKNAADAQGSDVKTKAGEAAEGAVPDAAGDAE